MDGPAVGRDRRHRLRPRISQRLAVRDELVGANRQGRRADAHIRVRPQGPHCPAGVAGRRLDGRAVRCVEQGVQEHGTSEDDDADHSRLAQRLALETQLPRRTGIARLQPRRVVQPYGGRFREMRAIAADVTDDRLVDVHEQIT